MNSQALFNRIRAADALSSFFYYLLISISTAGVAVIGAHIYVVLNSSTFVVPPLHLIMVAAVSALLSAVFAAAKALLSDRISTLYMVDKKMSAGGVVLAAADLEIGAPKTRFEAEIRTRAESIRRTASDKFLKSALAISAISFGVVIVAAAGVYAALFGISVPELSRGSIEAFNSEPNVFLDFDASPSHGIVPFTVSVHNKSTGFESFEWKLDGKVVTEFRITTEGPHQITLTGKREGGIQSVTKVVHGRKSNAVAADFQGIPRKGKPPLKVMFEDRSQGEITARKWELSDPEFEQVGKNPLVVEHTFKRPGTYTITLKVDNATASNTVTKKDYIVVEGDPGSGGQAGGGHSRNAKSSGGGGSQDQNQAGAKKGDLFGNKEKRPDVKFDKQELPDNPTLPDYYKEIISKIRSSEKGAGGGGGESAVHQILEKISYYERIQEKHRLLLNNYYEELLRK